MSWGYDIYVVGYLRPLSHSLDHSPAIISLFYNVLSECATTPLPSRPCLFFFGGVLFAYTHAVGEGIEQNFFRSRDAEILKQKSAEDKSL